MPVIDGSALFKVMVPVTSKTMSADPSALAAVRASRSEQGGGKPMLLQPDTPSEVSGAVVTIR